MQLPASYLSSWHMILVYCRVCIGSVCKAVFLCWIDDGSGRDYASDDEHLSYQQFFVFSMPFWVLLPIFTQTSESIFKCRPREKAKIYIVKERERERILNLHIAMLIFDI